MKKINTKFIILAVIFLTTSIAGGLLGSLITRAYLIKQSFNIPFFNQLTLSNSKLGGSNLIIREPKNVVIEQNVKVQETINSVNGSLAGIYKKATKSPQEKVFNINDYYLEKDKLGVGFIITSDGWLISNYTPAESKNLNSGKTKKTISTEQIVKNFTVITADKKAFDVDNIIYDSVLNLSFWHINAANLPVKGFGNDDATKRGLQILAINDAGWIKPLNIVGRDTSKRIKFSDVFVDEILVNEKIDSDFYNSFIFNLNSDLVGVINSDGKIITSRSFGSIANYVFKTKKIARPSLGLNFMPIAELANYSDDKGAVIVKDDAAVAIVAKSAAETAGLKEGDIITAIDNIEIDENNSIDKVINSYQAGTEITIKFLRNKEEKTVKIKLGSINLN